MDSAIDAAGLERMRAFVAAVLSDRPIGEPPPLRALQLAHMAPIAYRRGHAAVKGDYAATLIVADRRKRVYDEVVRAFDARGIKVAPIKGAAFLGTIYPDPAERPMNDMDVLVPVAQLSDAIRCMLELGFERSGFARKISDYYHAIVFLRGEVMFELHRNIVQRYRTRIRLDDIWRRAVRSPHGDHRLDPIDELLVCALHIARHELAAPAINYLDIHRLWARLDANAQAATRMRADEWRMARAFETVLAMTRMLERGERGRPEQGAGSFVLPTTDDVLLGVKPRRTRQLAQKLWLTEGAQERLGLGFSYVAAIAEGWWRARTFADDHAQR